MSKREAVTIYEVGPRDGLQNEPRRLGFEDKVWFVNALAAAGLTEIEVGAFVRPDRVPQMADTARLYGERGAGSLKLGRARAWSLVPNRKGLEVAIACGAEQIEVFTAATETFVQKNIGMTVRESLQEFSEVIRAAKKRRMQVRGYVSTAFGCPFEGRVPAKKALKVIEALADLGVTQVSIGDTIGVATPNQVDELVKPALKLLGRKRVAVHFHDTRGTALANSLRALEVGVRTFDSSAGGLGGCPFAPGATGNLATEDLVYLLQGLGFKTGVDLDSLCETSLELARRLSRPLSSRYLQAYAAGKCVAPL